MPQISYARHRFPPAIIQHAVWLYFRFALSYRDVEDLLAERGIDVSYETVRRWTHKFGRAYAGRIRRNRPRPSDHWHLDEVFIRVGGQTSIRNRSGARQPTAPLPDVEAGRFLWMPR